MANVELDLKNLKGLTKKKIADKAFQRKLGNRVLTDVLGLIAIGKSPVKGQGRYVGYRVDRAVADLRKKGTAPARKQSKRLSEKSSLYPNSVKKQFPRKQKRPVNLELSGKMLGFLGWEAKLGGVIFGLISAPKKIKDIFRAHNEGTNKKKKVPRRALIPVNKGETFTQFIQSRINSLYLARVKQLLKINNRR